MFNLSTKTLFVAAVTLTICSTAIAAPKTLSMKIDETLSGSAVSSALDTNGDQIPASFGLLQGSMTKPKKDTATVQIINEIGAPPMEIVDPAVGSMPVNTNCVPAVGQILAEPPLVNAKTIQRFSNGDLLYANATSQTLCTDVLTGAYTINASLKVIGGTGMFEGATGTLQAKGDGQRLAAGPQGVTSFSSISIRVTGTVSLMK